MSGNKIHRTLPPLLHNVKYCSRLSISLVSLTVKGLSDAALEECAVRVLWWGEANPAFIRPSVTYLVASDVLERYLQLCQVLEFTVSSFPDCSDIGSAFLYNPYIILKRPTFKLAIVDHQGNPIGQMVLNIVVSNGNENTVPVLKLSKNSGREKNSTQDKSHRTVTKENGHFSSANPFFDIKSLWQNQKKYLPLSDRRGNVPKEIAKYLLGNDMTTDEERRALVLLQEWSPSQSVVASFLPNV